MCRSDDLVMCLGDIDGHVGRHIDGLDGVHGGYGVGQMIWLCAWVTLMDTLVDILMDWMGFMEGMV